MTRPSSIRRSAGTLLGTRGGGIHESGDDLDVYSSTITDNTAGYGGFSAYAGGGIYTRYGGVFIGNTIIAGNEDTMGDASDCAGNDDFPSPLTSVGYNLIQDLDGCLIDGDPTGNITGEDPLLAPLADNGGPTQTHALDFGSPASNGGNPAGCKDPDGAALAFDQRGGEREVGPRCDIGAFERGAVPPSTPTPTPTATAMPTPEPKTSTPTSSPTAVPATPTPAGPTPTPIPSSTPIDGGIQGDTDCDKDADSVDSLFVLREVAGFGESNCIEQGDVDCDGDRDTVDALGIQRFVAALSPLPQDEPCADIGTPL